MTDADYWRQAQQRMRDAGAYREGWIQNADGVWRRVENGEVVEGAESE